LRLDSRGDIVQVGSYVNAPTIINLSVSSANTGPLAGHTCYRLWSSVDGFFQFGVDNTVVATTSSHPIKAGLDLLHWADANLFIAAIVASGTGQLFISRYDTVTDNP
jgi:hypothetical protein